MMVLVYHDLDRQAAALHSAVAQLGNGGNAEAVHRARNATRRIRGTLKVFRELLPGDAARHHASEMAWLAEALGKVRDLDVHRAVLDGCLAQMPAGAATHIEPYLCKIGAEHADARRALLGAFEGERFGRLAEDFSAFLDREPTQAALRRSLGFTARDGAAHYATRAIRKLRRTGRRIDRHSSAEQLHNLRIRCKRLRYQLESFEPVCGARLRPVLRQLKRLQDTLGTHHDAIVATERLHGYLATAETSEEMTHCRHTLRELIQAQRRDAASAIDRFVRDWQRFAQRVRPGKLQRRLEKVSDPSSARNPSAVVPATVENQM